MTAYPAGSSLSRSLKLLCKCTLLPVVLSGVQCCWLHLCNLCNLCCLAVCTVRTSPRRCMHCLCLAAWRLGSPPWIPCVLSLQQPCTTLVRADMRARLCWLDCWRPCVPLGWGFPQCSQVVSWSEPVWREDVGTLEAEAHDEVDNEVESMRCGHHTGHPGVNNTFLVNTEDEEALLRNDSSVLEVGVCCSSCASLAALRPCRGVH
jgi:hypothetical protein